ncbi:MAG TPA: hypothetical protein VNT77_11220 [Allosphingosinicella sp.]|nr:hypothetical protein [Allosphingosinicella sp.]
MPRFFFHLRNDIDAPDEEGTELPDLEAARAHATAEARNMISVSVLETGRINLHHRIDVGDETGQVVATVEFGNAVRIEG